MTTTEPDGDTLMGNLNIRLRPEIRTRLEALADAIEERDERDTRLSDATRMALTRGLRELEAEYGIQA